MEKEKITADLTSPWSCLMHLLFLQLSCLLASHKLWEDVVSIKALMRTVAEGIFAYSACAAVISSMFSVQAGEMSLPPRNQRAQVQEGGVWYINHQGATSPHGGGLDLDGL